MVKIKTFIEGNFSLLLILGAVLGFFLPSFGESADEIVIFLTALLIFMSCANIEPKDFLETDVFEVGLFTLIRFIVLPLIIYYFFIVTFPDFAIGALLLALMPAGVTVAALCSMSKANVVLGLSLIIMTSMLSPIVIPGVFSFIGEQVQVDVVSLFFTLLFVVVLPIFVYFFVFEKSTKAVSIIKKYNNTVPIIILSLILTIVVATQKEVFFENLSLVYTGFAVMMFLFFYLFGMGYSRFLKQESRIPFIFASGAMNNSLAVGVAFAYFDGVTVIFIVLSEIVFSIYIAVAQYLVSKQNKI